MTALPNPARAAHPQLPFRLGSRTFGPTERVVMAIVNRTPDSFYDRGRTFAAAAAVDAAERALDAGAAIVDIGGVRAAAGAAVSVQQEIERVVPVIAELRTRRPEAVISVDTWRSAVAREAVAAGADLINDAWQGHDQAVVQVAARTGAGLVCSHAGHLRPRTEPHRPRYRDVVADVRETVTRLAQRALHAGVRADGLLIDPAHDFGKTTVHSLEVTRRLGELVATGWPVLVALSNKDFVGETLDLPVTERLTGTIATTAVAAWLGARVFRAHNVIETRQALDMTSAILGQQPPRVARRGLTDGT